MSVLDNEHNILNQVDEKLLQLFADDFISNYINIYGGLSPTIEYHTCEYDIEGRPIYCSYLFSTVRYIICENKIKIIPINKDLPILIRYYPFPLPDFIEFDCSSDIFILGCNEITSKKFKKF